MDQLVTKFCYLIFGSNPFFVTFVNVTIITVFFLLSLKFKNKSLYFFLISILPSLAYLLRLVFNDYFLSDDFDHFVLVNKYSYSDIFIKGITGDNLWAFHRLFTGFWVFKLIYSVFGTNYYAFAIFNWIFHVVNTYLLFTLISKTNKNIHVVAISAFIFNTFYLTWISNIHELLAATFFLITFIILHKMVFEANVRTTWMTIIALTSYVLGIYSKEIVFLLPFCFLLYYLYAINIVKKRSGKFLDIIDVIKKIKLFFGVSLYYVWLFLRDFSKFSKYETGSGYDTVYKINSVLNHLLFYISDRIPLLYGTVGFVVLLAAVTFFDIYHKKIFITPLLASFFILLAPVLFLNKATSYYSYVPFIFLVIIISVILNKIYIKNLTFIFIVAFLFVFILKINKQFQENCFLLQFPRQHPRRTAVEKVVQEAATGDLTIEKLESDEARWFVENNYLKYFIEK